MKNILFVIALLFSFGVCQSDAQTKKGASEIEKIVVREMTKKETIKNPKYIKKKEGKKANKLIAVKGVETQGKIVAAPRPPRPPRPPSPPCPTGICHPISFIQDGLMLEQLLEIYPNAVVVVTDESKQKKEYKLNAKNTTIKSSEFKSFEGDLTVSIQLYSKNGKENPTPVKFNLVR